MTLYPLLQAAAETAAGFNKNYMGAWGMMGAGIGAGLAIIGAGAMGRGIAQIAAQAGSQVWLYDTQAGASAKYCGSGGAIVGTYPDPRVYARLVEDLGTQNCTVLRPNILAVG